MGSLDILNIINDWHKEEDFNGAIFGAIDYDAKERLARRIKLVFDAQPKSNSSNKEEVKPISEPKRRGRPPKQR